MRAVWCVRAGEQVIEEFHHNVSKPWIERLKRVDADTQKALDLDATVRPTLHAWPAPDTQRIGDRACMRPFIAARELRSLGASGSRLPTLRGYIAALSRRACRAAARVEGGRSRGGLPDPWQAGGGLVRSSPHILPALLSAKLGLPARAASRTLHACALCH